MIEELEITDISASKAITQIITPLISGMKVSLLSRTAFSCLRIGFGEIVDNVASKSIKNHKIKRYKYEIVIEAANWSFAGENITITDSEDYKKIDEYLFEIENGVLTIHEFYLSADHLHLLFSNGVTLKAKTACEDDDDIFWYFTLHKSWMLTSEINNKLIFQVVDLTKI